MTPVTEVELDGRDLKKALEGAKLHIERHIDEVNSLNALWHRRVAGSN